MKHCLAMLLCMLNGAPAAEHRVATAADIARAAEQARPGDVLVMDDGEWADQAITFHASGTAAQPITLCAATPGKVILTGKSSLVARGEHLVISGIHFKDGEIAGDAVRVLGNHCRLTESAFIGIKCKFFVHLFGVSNRVDHCYLAGKATEGPTLQIEVEGRPNHHRVELNHFGPRPPLGRNGGETIRVGYSHQSMTNSATLVERNLFDRCDGENEVISNKSCENVYRANTFLNCGGWLTLRHGNRCVVDGNFFLGQRKRGSGGVRVIGEDHVVINNYIDGVTEGGFLITSGIVDSPLVGYFQARNCLLAFNTVVNSRGPAVDLSAGLGSSRRTLVPANITLANNVFAVPEGDVFKGREGDGWSWAGNVTFGPNATAAREGVRLVDPGLVEKGGLWRPGPDSPLRGAAEGNFPAVKTDIDGQERKDRFDVGCDQHSDAPVVNRPMTPADVGPSWMERSLDPAKP